MTAADSGTPTTIIPISRERVFKRGEKVVATTPLPGVEVGTQGKVMYVTGVTWIRYHVLFEDGTAVSSVDAKQLASVSDWRSQQLAAERERRAAARKAAIAQRSQPTP